MMSHKQAVNSIGFGSQLLPSHDYSNANQRQESYFPLNSNPYSSQQGSMLTGYHNIQMKQPERSSEGGGQAKIRVRQNKPRDDQVPYAHREAPLVASDKPELFKSTATKPNKQQTRGGLENSVRGGQRLVPPQGMQIQDPRNPNVTLPEVP